MAKLKKIWIDEYQKFDKPFKAIRIDWDNDRHQSIEISGDDPIAVVRAFEEARSVVNADRVNGEI